ncbi:uncharacterized protein METZ01_LOCUS354319 [marine metagenome]|uniref:CENP-V/GFA domain-containing protein n=1 Tax=marine metagenome TaxID=408172 RepID=A0A382RWD1_9ZZZZ
MTVEEIHKGGCACGEVRYETKGEPQVHAVCHCRYCQLRTGSAFGMGAYFSADKVEFNSGEQTQFKYETVSGNKVTTSFCKKCGSTTNWSIESKMMAGMTAIAVGTFDPPTFWFKVTREIFCRSKAEFIENDIENKFETSASYKPIHKDEPRKTVV